MDSEMSDAWRQAGEVLGVRVMAPYSLRLPSGALVEVEAFLPDFGGPAGAIAVAADDRHRCSLAVTASPFVSQLSHSYGRFEQRLFRETLDDWGWFGDPSQRPSWYTGRTWA